MGIDIEKIKEELIGRKVVIINEYKTVFREVTDVIDVLTAIENPEIRSIVRDGLLYVIEGFIESVSEESISKALEKSDGKTQMYIYADTEVLPIEESLSERIEETRSAFNMIQDGY